jgi:hypothetical protein
MNLVLLIEKLTLNVKKHVSTKKHINYHIMVMLVQISMAAPTKQP